MIVGVETSFINYEGTVSAVLFFSGCNLRCPYCHNIEVVLNKLPALDFQNVLQFLHKRKNVYEGVVLTGGEPTINSDLFDVIAEIKKLDYKIKLDTNGLQPEKIQQVLPFIDYLALDVKTSPKLYNELLLSPYHDNYERLQKSIELSKQIASEIRLTLIKGHVNESIVEEIGQMIKGCELVFLQLQNRFATTLDPDYCGLELVSDLEVVRYQTILQKYVKQCRVR
ncbi:MAG: anaerobic ribonucleoside-triphosphate reductase activating protein [Nitrosarchaeum sp.]|nr:anaerobic ribonucleoside-triphosphate reductase activating protein [Nitrosarchaeum sp.]